MQRLSFKVLGGNAMTEYKRLEEMLQLQNEMLLVLIKSNSEIFEDVEEEVLDYFTKKVMENTRNETFKEEYGGIFKDAVHCVNCGSAKHLVYNGYNPREDVPYRYYLCTNCHTKTREYDDVRIEEHKE